MSLLKRGRLIRPGRPAIVGVITGSPSTAAAARAVKAGADAVELRVDTFRDRRVDKLRAAFDSIRRLKRPVLLTVRGAKEGGVNAVPDSERVELYRALAPFADAVDVELSSRRVLPEAVGAARRAGAAVIVSHHDFKRTPGTNALRRIVAEGFESGADAVKVAARAEGAQEIKRLALLLLECDNLVVIGMGRSSSFTRVFFPMLGSLLTYGSIGAAAAPGQLPVGAIRREFDRYGF